MTAKSTTITVLAGGAMDPGLTLAAETFRTETGHSVEIAYNLGIEAIQRMNDGMVYDVVVHPKDTLAQYFRPAGMVEDGGVPIGRVGLGAMIRPGAPPPDVSSVNAFKRSVLDADAILYTTATSGRYVEAMLRKIGLYEPTLAKTTRIAHGPELIDRVLRGTGRELAFMPVSTILTYQDRGIVLVGALPEALQHYLDFMAVPSTRSSHKDIGWTFARFCGGPGRALLAKHGVV
jgi:molybdate transport system substrate-binding protein